MDEITLLRQQKAELEDRVIDLQAQCCGLQATIHKLQELLAKSYAENRELSEKRSWFSRLLNG